MPGADPAVKNKHGQTATDVAEMNGNLEAAQAILVLGSAPLGSGTRAGGRAVPESTTSQ